MISASREVSGAEVDDLFRREMLDVTPLTRGIDRADVAARSQGPSNAQLVRREDAQKSLGNELDGLSDSYVEHLSPHDPIEYRRDGIQVGVLERLRHGGYPPEAQLNLIRRPLIECRREVQRFVRDGWESELRSLLVIHGRGRDSESHAALIRAYLVHWLEQIPQVQAWCSATPRHGGLGATLIMLRKSRSARDTNRERHQKRRG
ncbi:DNA endonuclease SmrA [Cobetia crustatorum]|uniref:DNA endonuclease SmrA n=2 Tax=Halomonadaceae TaxID=28256 RepID=A0A558HKX1_9GAMM|nr:DNA endonuclease SmrA [Cobetia crustatorum]